MEYKNFCKFFIGGYCKYKDNSSKKHAKKTFKKNNFRIKVVNLDTKEFVKIEYDVHIRKRIYVKSNIILNQ